MVDRAVCVCARVRWEDPYGGECDDTFVLSPSGNEMTQVTEMLFRGTQERVSIKCAPDLSSDAAHPWAECKDEAWNPPTALLVLQLWRCALRLCCAETQGGVSAGAVREPMTAMLASPAILHIFLQQL